MRAIIALKTDGEETKSDDLLDGILCAYLAVQIELKFKVADREVSWKACLGIFHGGFPVSRKRSPTKARTHAETSCYPQFDRKKKLLSTSTHRYSCNSREMYRRVTTAYRANRLPGS
jgi:hypothetical protein